MKLTNDELKKRLVEAELELKEARKAKNYHEREATKYEGIITDIETKIWFLKLEIQ